MNRSGLTCSIAALLAGSSAALATGPSFRPDTTLAGQPTARIGSARWSSGLGETIADLGKQRHGVLLLDHRYQNVGLYSEIACEGCEAGLLLRANRTPNGGLTGILVSISSARRSMAAVTIDGQGAITSRTPLEAKPGETRLASPFGVIVSQALKDAPPMKSYPLPADVSLPELDHASGAYVTGWNSLDLVSYGSALEPWLNGGHNPDLPSATLPDTPDFGDVGLYVSGSGTARFRNVVAKDLNSRDMPAETTSPQWRKQQLDAWESSWGVGVGDINRDGKPDLVAGPYWWEGPDFTSAHEIYPPVFYDPASDYPQKSFINFVYDFNGDGWPDVLTISGNSGYSEVTLYTNPKGESRHWQARRVLHLIGNEETLLVDIDGDGKPELIHAYNNAMAYSKWNADGTKWTTVQISDQGPWGAYVGHGIGAGDINGDGRMDILNAYGWWEQPAKDADTVKWTYHPVAFGRFGETQFGAGGAALGVYDVNGDGLPDVVTSLEGHGFGLAWYEQKRDAAGHISFVPHMIMDGFLNKNAGGVTFTELHGAAFADIDGDGIPDLVTGKRLMSHLFNLMDPDSEGPAVLYVYRTVRDPTAPGGARFEPMLVDNRSGVGSHPTIADVNSDGRPDILVSGALGTFVFYNEMPHAAAK